MFPFIRRHLRFRLRTLLLLFTAAVVWLCFHVNSARLQQHSTAAIKKYGGWVRYDFQFPSGEYTHKDFDGKAASWVPKWLLDQFGVDLFHDVVQVSLNYSEDNGTRQENHNPSDEALQYLHGFPQLRVLLLSESQASDSSMRLLAALKKLQHLLMWDVSAVSDKGVAHLQGLKELRYIHLSSSQITDKSLAVFSQMPSLEGLSLQFNRFTDEGLSHVARLDGLRELWVCGTTERPNPITDDGLKRLERLRKLKTLAIQSTDVSPEAVAAFLRAVPACRVVR